MAEEQSNQKRQVAYKARIKDILNGKYVVEEGWIPNHVLMDDGRKVSRVNLIAAIIDKDETGTKSITVDDGSGRISVRWFEEKDIFEGFNVGDVVLLIGRIREYGSERYVLPEILKKVENPRWIDFRKFELGKDNVDVEKVETAGREETVEVKQEIVTEDVVDEKNESAGDKVIEYIRKNDKGEGIDLSDILKVEEKGEEIVNTLLQSGEVFEVRPGRLKVLE